jgi:hypothetical protein
LGISKLSTDLSLDRLEPATSVRSAATSSPNKDGEKDSPNQDSLTQDSLNHNSAKHNSAKHDSANHDSANKDGEPHGEDVRLGPPASEPDSLINASADGTEGVSAEPPHKIDSLA